MLRCAVQNLAWLAVRPPVLTRGMALEGTKFSEGEKAIEDLYFTKEDQRLMSKLLAKVGNKVSSFRVFMPLIFAARTLRSTDIVVSGPLLMGLGDLMLPDMS